MSSGAEGTLEGLLELPDEGLNQTVVGEAVIGVVADDHVVQDLDHQELAGPHEISGQFSIFR